MATDSTHTNRLNQLLLSTRNGARAWWLSLRVQVGAGAATLGLLVDAYLVAHYTVGEAWTPVAFLNNAAHWLLLAGFIAFWLTLLALIEALDADILGVQELDSRWRRDDLPFPVARRDYIWLGDGLALSEIRVRDRAGTSDHLPVWGVMGLEN